MGKRPYLVLLQFVPQLSRRFCRAILAPFLPNAVRVRFGKCAIVRARFAAAPPFLMLRRAAAGCFGVVMIFPLIPRRIIIAQIFRG
jgi:hypothetical protein